MASNYTENFQLNQWERSDNLLMAEFNADNAKIEAALTELKNNMPHIYAGSYVGTGTYGSSNPNVLTFDFTPKLLIMNGYVATGIYNDNFSRYYKLYAVRGSEYCHYWYSSNGADTMYLIWGENSVSWYNKGSFKAQLNDKGHTYHYVVIG